MINCPIVEQDTLLIKEQTIHLKPNKSSLTWKWCILCEGIL